MQETVSTPNISYDQQTPNDHHRKKSHNAPHEKMVGAIIGFLVVSIVMSELFWYAWWMPIPIVATLVHMIKAIVNYGQNKEARKNYKYSTSSDEVIQMWVGFVIVSIVMNALFPYAWFASIPIVVLLVKAIFKSIEYGKTKKQARMPQQQPIQITVKYPKPEPMPYVAPAMNPIKAELKFCSMCGTQHRAEASFCPACGNEF